MDAMIFIAICLHLAFPTVRAAPAPSPETITISASGVSNHGKGNLICLPISATDIAVYFIVNYLAHVASIRVPQGYSGKRTLWAMIMSLLYPISGIQFALQAISRWNWEWKSNFPFLRPVEDSLESAQRAGALIMAIRSLDWVPHASVTTIKHVSLVLDEEEDGKVVFDGYLLFVYSDPKVLFATPDAVQIPTDSIIFGNPPGLPAGYMWAVVPWNMKVGPVDASLRSLPLGGSRGFFQAVAAVVQTVSAGITLYRSRGDQVNRYGFTAFGFTVVPYLLMSIVNFFAHISSPRYNFLYIVHSEILDEAILRLQSESQAPPPSFIPVGKLVPRHPDNEELFDVTVQKEPEGPPDPSSQTDLLIAATSDRPIFVFEPCLATHENKPQTDVPAGERKDAQDEEITGPKTITPPPSTIRVVPYGGKESLKGRITVPSFPYVEMHSMSINRRFVFFGGMFRLEVVPALAIGAAGLAINGAISHFQWGTASRPAWRAVFTAWLVLISASSLVHILIKLVLICLAVLIGYIGGLVSRPKGEDKLAERDAKGGSIKRKPKPPDRTLNFVLAHHAARAVRHVIALGVLVALVVVMVQQLIEYGDCTYLDL